MNESAARLRKAAEQHGASPNTASPGFVDWMISKSLPAEVVSVLERCMVASTLEVGSLRFYGEADIRSINSDKGVPVALRDHLLIVGCCPNGDPIAIDVKSGYGAAGYIASEDMWHAKDVRACFVEVAASLADLVDGAASGNVACDYWEARQKSASTQTD